MDNMDEYYDATDSEDEDEKRETVLLNKYKPKKTEYSDSEDEVFGVTRGDDTDESDGNEIALSDVEGQEDDNDLPDIRAWGKDKKKFYGADYVDPDYGGFQGKDAQAAEIEEEEAKNLQIQLLQQLNDGDFSLEIFQKDTSAKHTGKTQLKDEIIKDISHLSKKQKLQILEKQSPEFFGLLEDFKAKMTIVKDYLQPILQKYRKGQVPSGNAIDFVQTQYHLILSYVTNIYMYLLLRNTKDLLNHPVVKRLYQYRQLLEQMDPVFEEIIKPQIELLLTESNEKSKSKKVEKSKKKTLKLLSNLGKQTDKKKKQKSTTSEGMQEAKRIKLDEPIDKKVSFADIPNSSEDEEMEATGDINENIEDQEEIGKRAITYQIAKNKGLTPHRKKELRNPRVKNKLKYRKAVIRRKGAVREPRKELSRYSGEISGIKASVSKSIKFKS